MNNSFLRSKWSIFIVTSMANLGVSFAINSLNLALPLIREEFGVSQSDVSWLALVYSLLPSCMLLLFGRLADICGYRRQYIFGFGFFTAVSMLAPVLSFNLPTLIVFRALQGIGYSILISITQATIFKTFPENERGKALGINSVFVSVGFAAGPTIGGVLLKFFTWHSIFYFCAIFSVLGLIGTFLAMEDDTTEKEARPKIDVLGGVCFMIFIGALSIGINFVDDWGLSWKIWMLFAISAAGLVLFLIRERYAEHPLLPLSIFKNRTFTLANCTCLLSYLTQQLTTYLYPFFLAEVMLLSAYHSGLIMLTAPVMMMIFSPVGGGISDKKGTKLPAVAGLALIILSCLGTAFFRQGQNLFYVIAVLALMGAGNGLSVSAINNSILGSVDTSMSGAASGTLATMRNIGNTLGIAIGSVMLTMREVHYSAAGLSQASVYLRSQRDIFLFGAAAAGAAIFLILLIHDKKKKQKVTLAASRC